NIDDIIVFHKDGKYKIIRVSEKTFIGTDILHVDIFKKNDTRTIYNTVYRDGKGGVNYIKRFNVTGVARDKDYDLTQGKQGSKILYFTANTNGEAETIRVQLKPAAHLKKMEFAYDFSTLMVKSRAARGNLLTKYEVKSISLKQKGHSTLGGRKVWFDPDVLRLNYDGQGRYLDEFKDDDRILVVTNSGNYYLTTFDLTAHFDDDIRVIEKFDAEKVWTLVFWNAEQGFYYGKRFTMDAQMKAQNFLGDNEESRIVLLSDRSEPVFSVRYEEEWREPATLEMTDFIAVKSPRAKGKRLTTLPVTAIEDITPEQEEEPEKSEDSDNTEQSYSIDNTDTQDNSENTTPPAPHVPLTISSDMPEDSKPVDGSQLSLF
nr:DNA gyrase/topoisomerase IV subunit A [Paludibacteraceae bacterium]